MTQGLRPDGQIFASQANEGESETFPAISRGWGVTIDGKDESGNAVADSTNGVPPMEWDNAQRNRVDNQIWWLMQHAVPQWQSGTWDTGAFVSYTGWIYYNASTVETSGEPGVSSDWKAILPLTGGDGRYLQASNNLSEISASGSAAQAAARLNLGLGDVATHSDSEYVNTVNGVAPDASGNVVVSIPAVPVTSVNGKTGAVVLSAADVHALPDTTVIPPAPDLSMYETKAEANTKYLAGWKLGTQGWLEVGGGTTEAPLGCVLTGGGDFGSDNGSYFYRPALYLLNGVWVTATNLSATALLNLEKYQIASLQTLSRLTLTEDKSTLLDELGLDWYRARSLLSGNKFIAYDPVTGVIRQIDDCIDMLWPVNLSVTGVETLPEGCTINGCWKFDGSSIYEDTSIVNSQIYEKNHSKRNKEMSNAAAYVFAIQSSTAVGNTRDGDEDNLRALQQYADALRDVDLTMTSPVWPTPPCFL